MYWDVGEIAKIGGHAASGVTQQAYSWNLVTEEVVPENYDMWLLVFNPNSQETRVQATFRRDDGTVEELIILVPGTTRRNIWANQIFPTHPVSITVESLDNTGIVVDCSMYWSSNEEGAVTLSGYDISAINWIGGHSSAGYNR